jgi:dienelactone hydrolase
VTSHRDAFHPRLAKGATGVRRPPAFGRDDTDIETDLIVIPTEDRHSWDGMIFRPRRGAIDPRLAVLVIHGSVGHYLTGMPRRLAFHLAERGYAALTANTRMANYGVFFGTGLIDEAQLDIAAAVRALRERGFRRIVLLGYSMGSTMVTHYQAVHAPPEVIGVCTIAHPLSLPLSLRRRWERFDSRPSYNEMCSIVTRHMEGSDDPERDRIIIVQRATGPTGRPEHAEIWTYRTWWHSRGPEALSAESRRWVGLLRVPLALIQAADDLLIPKSEGEQLRRLARDGGCPEVHLEYIDGANHTFDGHDIDAIEAAVTWVTHQAERTHDAAAAAPLHTSHPVPGGDVPEEAS